MASRVIVPTPRQTNVADASAFPNVPTSTPAVLRSSSAPVVAASPIEGGGVATHLLHSKVVEITPELIQRIAEAVFDRFNSPRVIKKKK